MSPSIHPLQSGRAAAAPRRFANAANCAAAIAAAGILLAASAVLTAAFAASEAPEAAGAAPSEPRAAVDALSSGRARGGTVVRLGLLDFESSASYLSRVEDIQSTILQYLQETTPGIIIEPHWYKTAELEEAVKRGDVEFFLGSSGFFVEMRRYGVRDIGTIVSRSFPDPNQCVAGVIFVDSRRKDLQSIADLKHQRAAATDPRNFMTFQIAMNEIAAAGYDPDRFFKDIRFTDSQPERVAAAVASGAADVGLLRACMLEALERAHPEWQGRFRVINEQKGARAERLGCRYSTAMFPGWTFAVAPHTPPILTRHIASSLLALDPKRTASGFEISFTTDYARVNDLFKRLRIGPYEHLRHWTIERAWRAAWPFVLLAAGLLAAWILHSLRLEKLVRRRTAALEAAWAREKAAEDEAHRAAEKLDQLQRVSLVGELSAIFAHELGQPLSAMRYFARSLRTLSERPDADPKLVSACVSGLQKQITHAGEILDRVRSYAKQGADRSQPLDLAALLKDALEELRSSKRLQFPTLVDAPEPVPVRGDPVELRIVVVNLLKNANEALTGWSADPSRPTASRLAIRASARRLPNGAAELAVENDGPLLSPETVARLGSPLQSKKKEGLGLGLLICRTIAEAHVSKLVFEARALEAGGGLRAAFIMPAQDAGAPQQNTLAEGKTDDSNKAPESPAS